MRRKRDGIDKEKKRDNILLLFLVYVMLLQL